MKYELICGLETHIELLTDEKIFCACLSRFGGEPNSRCCPVCAGLPGALPLLNMQAVKLAVMAGLALGCSINRVSFFDRKNYFYPDLPKSYQITQYDRPLCSDGSLTLPSGAIIGIERIHIEEDAGKLIKENGQTLIDYNRSGVPLIEIVSRPDFTSAEQAGEYLEQLRLIMKHIGVSDCRMQEGSLRCDVNVSVRRAGDEHYGVRAEIKNVNSIAFVKKAIEYEAQRQIAIYESGGTVTPETRRWSAANGQTQVMREKEAARDYRFMREPDLRPLIIEPEYVEALRAALPELPEQRVHRYISMGLNEADARLLARHRQIAEFFDAAVSYAGTETVSKLMLSRIFARLTTEEQLENADIAITAQQLGELAALLEKGRINTAIARETLDRMLDSGKDAMCFLTDADLAGLSDDLLRSACEQAVADNKAACDDFAAGREKALMPVIGAVMRFTKGRADAARTRQILTELIKEGFN